MTGRRSTARLFNRDFTQFERRFGATPSVAGGAAVLFTSPEAERVIIEMDPAVTSPTPIQNIPRPDDEDEAELKQQYSVASGQSFGAWPGD